MDWYLSRLGEFKDSIAFREEQDVVTYEQLTDRIQHFDKLLKVAGVSSGDVVAVTGRSDSELFAAVVAVMNMSAVAIPLTHQSPISFDTATSVGSAQFQLSVEESLLERIEDPQAQDYPLLNSLRCEGIGGLILFSSGSTGRPKAILYDSKRILEKFRLRSRPIKALLFLSLDHFGGLNTIFSILSSGGEAVVLRDRRVETVCSAIQEHGVEVLPATPSFLRLLFISGALSRFNLSCLKKITYGTEPMTQHTLNRVRKEFPGVKLQQTYGLTEVGVLRSKSRSDGSIWMKIGGEGFEWKIKNGTLWIRSQFQMRGYLNAEADVDEDGYFNTQDEALVDGDYVQILGRMSDVINVGGEKVYPIEIENIVQGLENILEVLAFGQSNPLLGQIIVVDVVLREEEDHRLLRKRVRDACGVALGNQKVPSKVRVVESVELSARQKKFRKC